MVKYDLTREENERLTRDFTCHKPKDDQLERYADIRNNAGMLALFIMRQCPKSRELSLALTKIEEAVFWANAAIARNEKE